MVRPNLDFVPRDEKPGPMQKNFNSEELEQPDGASMGWHVVAIYPTPGRSKQDFCRAGGWIGFDAVRPEDGK
jgi:hypothetical protein